MMKFKHFFWDFDGTLYDTYDRINRATQKTLAAYGFDVPLETLRPMIKHSLTVPWRVYVEALGETEEAFRNTYHRFSELEPPDSIQPYPGAGNMLRAVVEKGGYNYLYTHRSMTSARPCLERNGFWPLFRDFVTSADGFLNKPAPDALLYLLQKHGLDRTECVMIGDRDIDLQAGWNAGMAGVLYDPEDYFHDFETDYRYPDFASMQRALTEN